MSYDTPAAFRAALEQRIVNESRSSGVAVDRLRRRVLFQCVLSRLETAEPGRWVLKGGMALEVRLRDRARVTKDLDLGLRGGPVDADGLRDRLIEALTADPHGDGFLFAVRRPAKMAEDGDGEPTWRAKVEATLAGKSFGGLQLDISPRDRELEATERLPLPNALTFAQIIVPEVEIIDVARHAAEKLHAMTKTYGERENSRVRDLPDVVLLVEEDLLETCRLTEAVAQVWQEREQSDPPAVFPDLPVGWADRYATLAADLSLHAGSLEEASVLITDLWGTLGG